MKTELCLITTHHLSDNDNVKFNIISSNANHTLKNSRRAQSKQLSEERETKLPTLIVDLSISILISLANHRL